MEKEFSTKHGVMVATLPDNSTMDNETLQDVADHLDQLAWRWETDNTSFEGKDSEGNVTSHLEWHLTAATFDEYDGQKIDLRKFDKIEAMICRGDICPRLNQGKGCAFFNGFSLPYLEKMQCYKFRSAYNSGENPDDE